MKALNWAETQKPPRDKNVVSTDVFITTEALVNARIDDVQAEIRELRALIVDAIQADIPAD